MFFKIITGTTGLLAAPDSVQGGSGVVTAVTTATYLKMGPSSSSVGSRISRDGKRGRCGGPAPRLNRPPYRLILGEQKS
ncbi:hypothetical protein HanOQP8_Chr08g0293391 [Helianthus annuus]|nr:hypothetical protein HanLR1_Chr08g0285881 [Helianthus annuus]KAJ0723034.1 hypothetical protein HanOQP8_Chr08g0293391 [Helianthus annuus]